MLSTKEATESPDVRESRIWDIFAHGIQNLIKFGCGIQNPWAMESRTAQGIWNPATDWNLEPTLH